MLQCGLYNLGNSCYINSALQYLIHLPKFNNIILTYKNSGNQIIDSYIKLYEAYTSDKVDISIIQDLVTDLNTTLNANDHFDVLMQNDASEFLIKFLEKINIEQLSELFEINLETTKEFHKTIVKGKKELKCEETKPVENIVDTSVILRFDDKKQIYNIGSELTKAYDGIVEEVTKKSEYLNCDNVVDASNNKAQKVDKFPFKRIDKITTFPDIIKINLNIFDANLKKNFMKLEIPNEWEYGNNFYKLNGIVVHIGETLGSGHYEYFSLETDSWFEYSDTNITKYKPPKKEKISFYKLSTQENNVFYTNKTIPCPYILSYIKTVKNMST